MVVRRPCTVKIEWPNLDARDVIEALIGLEGITDEDILCAQRVSDGSVVVTFPNQQIAADLAELDVVVVKGLPTLVSHVDSTWKVYVKIFDLQYEVENGALKAKMAMASTSGVMGW